MTVARALTSTQLCGLTLCLGIAAATHTARLCGFRLLINTSGSVPPGLYLQLPPPRTLTRGMLVVFPPPEPMRALIVERGWLPLGAPLIKPVAALAPDTVCVIPTGLSINGVHRADHAPTQDHQGRPLPHWTGCTVLTEDEVFVLSTRIPTSVDSRSFGPISRHTVIGRALPLLTWPVHDEHEDHRNTGVLGVFEIKQ